jgi:hypothetical protein
MIARQQQQHPQYVQNVYQSTGQTFQYNPYQQINYGPRIMNAATSGPGSVGGGNATATTTTSSQGGDDHH